MASNLVTGASQNDSANTVGSVTQVTAVTGSAQTVTGSSGTVVEGSSQAVIAAVGTSETTTGASQSGGSLSLIDSGDVSGASQDTAGTINSSSVSGASQNAVVGSADVASGSLGGSASMSIGSGNGWVPAVLDDIEFDVLISIETKYSADAPDYAMEDGSYTSDSILKKPMELTVVALVSEHPVTFSSRHSGRTVAEVRSALEAKYFAGDLVTFTTASDVYENMAITSLKLPQDDYLDAMEVTIGLKYINITAAQTADYDYDGVSDSADSTSTSSADDESSTGSSWLYQILGLFGIV